MAKKRILILASWFPKHATDPAGRFILDQAESLAALADVRVVDCSHRSGFLPHRLKNCLLLRKIRNEHAAWRPDVIHAHAAYPAGAVALRLKKQWNVPVVLTEHTGPLKLLEPYFESEKAFNAHFAGYDRVVAVSSRLAGEISQRCPQAHLEVIGNVVDQRFLSGPLAVAGVPRASFAVISRLTEEKGISALARVLSTYETLDGPVLDLVVKGDGPLRSLLDGLSKTLRRCRFTFLPPGPPEEVRETLSRASFLLLPSQVETFSLVAAEAIAMGRAVLGFKCGGPEDFVNGERGMLVALNDCQALAARLKEFATDPAWALTPSAAATRRAQLAERFSAEKIAARLLELYESLSS